MCCNLDIPETGKTSTEEEKLVSGGGEMVAMFLPENFATCADRHTVGSWTFLCNRNPENFSPAGPEAQLDPSCELLIINFCYSKPTRWRHLSLSP